MRLTSIRMDYVHGGGGRHQDFYDILVARYVHRVIRVYGHRCEMQRRNSALVFDIDVSTSVYQEFDDLRTPGLHRFMERRSSPAFG